MFFSRSRGQPRSASAASRGASARSVQRAGGTAEGAPGSARSSTSRTGGEAHGALLASLTTMSLRTRERYVRSFAGSRFESTESPVFTATATEGASASHACHARSEPDGPAAELAPATVPAMPEVPSQKGVAEVCCKISCRAPTNLGETSTPISYS